MLPGQKIGQALHHITEPQGYLEKYMTVKEGMRYDSTTIVRTTEYSGGYSIHDVYQPPWTTSDTTTRGYSLPYSRVGGDRPWWREIRRQGGDASNAYSMQDMRLTKVPVQAEASFWVNPYWKPLGQYKYSISGTMHVDTEPTLPGPMSAQSENQAKSILVGRANSMIHSLQGGTVLGELAETIHSIRRPAQGLRQLFSDYGNDLRKGRRFRNRKDKRKYLRNLWLEYALSMRPLIMDTKGAGEALARIVNGSNPVTPLRSFGRDKLTLTMSTGNELSNGPLRAAYGIKIEDRWFSVGWAALREQCGAGTLDILGLSFDQFLPTVWELIPYSFVIDYFSNVGLTVAAGAFDTGRFQYWGMSSRATRRIWSYVYADNTDKTDPAYISSSVSPGETALEVTQFARLPGVSLVPNLTVYLPKYGTQFANVAALIDSFKRIQPY